MKRLLALTFFIASSALAQNVRTQNSFASDFQTVPVMANVTGNFGARFHSYVALLNPTASAAHIDVTLFDAAGATHDATITLAAGEQKTYANFLEEVFHSTGGGAVTFRSDNPAERFILDTEVRVTPGGYSTAVPVLEFAGSSSPSFSTGITVDSNSRTNIGCFNQSSGANTVRATVFDKSGAIALGTVDLDLNANAWGQTAVNTIVNDGFIRFEPSEAAVCYAVVVSNTTNDGRFISATEYQP
jgi:hypothetical protein